MIYSSNYTNLSSAFQLDYTPFWMGYLPEPDAGFDSCVLVSDKSFLLWKLYDFSS